MCQTLIKTVSSFNRNTEMALNTLAMCAEQAEVVRYIFESYAEGLTISRIIQKKAPLDFYTKKPNLNIEYESLYISDDHEAIVSRELWNKVQESSSSGSPKRIVM